MSKRLLDHEFYSVDVEKTNMSLEERALYFYQEFFSRNEKCISLLGRLFTRFDAFYESKHPENLLQFPIIMKAFEEMMLKEVEEKIMSFVCF